MKLRLRRTEVELSYALLCLAAASVLLGVWRDLLWCAAAIAVHEGGHLLIMAKLGCFPQKIKIAPFWIDIIDGGRAQRSTRHNAWIIFFGPFANFICFLGSYLVYLWQYPAMLPFAAANLSVGLFNLLPVLTLDGGQLLWLLLCRRMPQERAARAVNACTLVCLVPLTALGVGLVLQARNPSLLFVSAYLAAALLCRKGKLE